MKGIFELISGSGSGVGERMIFQIILFVWEFMMDVASIVSIGSDEKDLGILHGASSKQILIWQ